MDGNTAAIEKGTALTEAGNVQWLPTPVMAEVHYGVAYTASEEARRTVQNALLGYPRVDIDEEIARTASTLLAAADRAADRNSGVETNDAHIGAIADVLDEPVLTANPDDFETLGSMSKPIEQLSPTGVGVVFSHLRSRLRRFASDSTVNPVSIISEPSVPSRTRR